MKRYLLLFNNTRAVISAERLCKKNCISVTILPVPRSISTECGMAIEFQLEDRETIVKLLNDTELEYSLSVWEKG